MDILIFILLLALFSFLIATDYLKTSISAKKLLIGWFIKLSFAGLFILVYSYYYTDGQLYGDVANFIQDSRVLADFARNEPLEFSKVFFGFNSNDLILHQTHLAETNIWSYGDNGDFINDNRLIIRINALIHLFAFGSIWTHVLCFAFISFTGVLLIYKTFHKLTNRPLILFFALLLFPTVSFWGSGISKETLLVFSIGLFFYAVNRIRQNQHLFWSLVLLIFGTLLLLFNKPHVGLFLIPMVLVLVAIDRFGFSKWVITIISLSLLAGITILCFTPSKINIVERISYKQQDLQNQGIGGIFFVNDTAFCAFDYKYLDHFEYKKKERLISVTTQTEGEYKLFGEDDFHPFSAPVSDKEHDVYHIISPSRSIVSVPPINNSPLQLLKNTPLSIVNVLIRPFPNDGGSPLKYLVLLENIFFLILVLIVLRKRTVLSEKTGAWFNYLLFSGISLILIIGWTTPILGAIARYKMAPILLIVIALCLLLPSKIKENEIPA
jgi:hypothetical protein